MLGRGRPSFGTPTMTRTRTALRAEPLEDRLAPAAGDLDLAFGTGGIVTLPDGQDFGALAPLPAGGLVAFLQTNSTAPASILVRFNADGTRDPGFGTGGQVSFP